MSVTQEQMIQELARRRQEGLFSDEQNQMYDELARRELLPTFQSQQQPEQLGLFERIGERGGERLEKAGETLESLGAGEFSTRRKIAPESTVGQMRALETPTDQLNRQIGAAGEAGIQLLGQGTGFVLDSIGEGLVSAWRAIPKNWREAGAEQLDNFFRSPTGQAITTNTEQFFDENPVGQGIVDVVEGGMDAWKQLEKESPRVAKDIRSVVNIGLLMSPVKGKKKPSGKMSRLDRLSQKIRRSAVIQKLQAQKNSFIEIVRKPNTDTGARSFMQGFFQTKRVRPTTLEKNMAKEIARIPGTSTKKSFTNNYNIINDFNFDDIAKLKIDLDKIMPKEIPALKQNVVKKIDKFVDNALRNNRLIMGDPAAQSKLLAFRESAIRDVMSAETPAKLSGILSLRQRLDTDLLKVMSEAKAFGSAAGGLETTTSLAHGVIRDALNSSVKQFAGKKLNVAQRLNRQHLRFKALENMAPKVNSEPVYLISRIFGSVAPVATKIRSEALNTAALAMGTTAIAASSQVAPYLATGVGSAILLRGAYKGLTGPFAKRGIAGMIRMVDDVIKNTVDPNVIRNLRIDRAALVELLDNYDTIYNIPQEAE